MEVAGKKLIKRVCLPLAKASGSEAHGPDSKGCLGSVGIESCVLPCPRSRGTGNGVPHVGATVQAFFQPLSMHPEVKIHFLPNRLC